MDGIARIPERSQGNNNQPSRPRKPSTLIYGKSKNVDENEVYLAANVNLVASGVSKDATANQLKDFLAKKGLDTVAIENLTKHPEARTNTFKVTIAPADYDKALNPEIWPFRVAIRHFKVKRFSPQNNSWQQQSQQTGGYVHEQRQHPHSRSRSQNQQQNQHEQRRQSFVIPQANRFDGLQETESN